MYIIPLTSEFIVGHIPAMGHLLAISVGKLMCLGVQRALYDLYTLLCTCVSSAKWLMAKLRVCNPPLVVSLSNATLYVYDDFLIVM